MFNGVLGPAFSGTGITWLVFDLLLKIPFTAEICGWLGCSSAGKSNFLKLVTKSKNVALLPGGFEEATIYEKNKHRVYIKHRKGFVKMALTYGYKVHYMHYGPFLCVYVSYDCALYVLVDYSGLYFWRRTNILGLPKISSISSLAEQIQSAVSFFLWTMVVRLYAIWKHRFDNCSR